MTAKRKKIYDALLAAKMRKPFVPFAIRLKNGKRFEVKNWLHVGFSRGNPRIVVLIDGRARYDYFDWPDVEAIDIHEPAT